ncbi:sortase [Cryobacterium arcticum]|uniref:Sortase n=1 Tax=Cryobacterium arcticum TaxID=670052 RepID=A0A317ZS48_9MICO|nr:sortase [Cryobacterium arcticum]PXA70000.1 sortase [Cryobacterium arcticum]
MFKKSLAAIALAVLAIFAVPAAANAAGYVPVGNITVSGAVTPGSVVTVSFTDGSFTPGEDVSFTLTGENAVGATLATFKSVVNSQSLVKTASDTGAVSLDVKLPTDATGTYTVTATGLTSGTVGTASLTVGSADAGTGSSDSAAGGLASTGYNTPMLAIWGAAGALLLGVALVVVLGVVRRQRATA